VKTTGPGDLDLRSVIQYPHGLGFQQNRFEEGAMALPGLTLIGETINDSVPRTKKLFDEGDLAGIQQIAVEQVERGAQYVDVNVGRRGSDFMATVIKKVQEVVSVPLSIDSPDVAMLRAGLAAYDPERGGGKPVLNSISAMRAEGLELAHEQPCRVILLVTERKDGDESKPCKTAQEAYDTARELFDQATGLGFTEDDVIFDPGIGPVGADTEAMLRKTVHTLQHIHEDETLSRCHASVGLSNFTIMLPKRRQNGQPIRSTLESAFLTIAMPLGLDTIIGSVKRKYQVLPEDEDAVTCLREIMELDGFEAITRLDTYCRG
jgi:cobalamin-dependent methionine synthase I